MTASSPSPERPRRSSAPAVVASASPTMTRSTARPVPGPPPPSGSAATRRRAAFPRVLAVAAGAALAAGVAAAVAGHLPGAIASLVLGGAVLAWDRWATRLRHRRAVRLAERSAPRSRVLVPDPAGSTGDVRELAADELRPGMLVALAEGDVLATAATVVDAADLLVDDYALAGDSAPVPRRASPGDLLREGTMVLRGTGTATVEQAAPEPAVDGVETAAGDGRHLVTLVGATAATLGGLAVVVALVGLAVGTGREALLAAASILVGVAAVVAGSRAVPVVTAVAAERLVPAGVTVRGPDVLAGMAAVDLVAVSSTATLTSERSQVVQTWAAGGETVEDLARAALYAGPGADEAIDRALAEWALGVVEGATAVGVDAPLEAAGPRHASPDGAVSPPPVAEVPWDAARRRVTTAHADGGEVLVVCKGAPDAIWPLLVTSSDGVSAGAVAGQPVADAWLDRGWRVLGLATTRRTVAGNTAGRLEWGLRLVGLVALTSTPRDGAAAAVADLRSGGLDVAMMTADHEDTALAVASAVGIIPRPRGAPLATGDGLEGGMWADDVRVFGRTAPEQHRDVVARWQSAGHVVALTGSTMADAPALRRCDVGVCLGAADEAARSAAVLHGDDADLSLVVRVVAAARRVRHLARRVLAVSTVAAGAVAAVALVGFLAGGVWLWPGQAAVVSVAAVLPTVVASALVTGSREGLGPRPTLRVLDAWWWLWVTVWLLGATALAVVAAAVGGLAGAAAADVAPAVLAGALPVGGVLAVTDLVARPPADGPAPTGRRRSLATLAVTLAVALSVLATGVLHEGAVAPWAAWVAGPVAGVVAVLVARLTESTRSG